MYIFGGCDDDGVTRNDMIRWDMNQRIWQRVLLPELPCSLHAAACLVGSKWYISGGLNNTNEATSGMFCLDLETFHLVKCQGTFDARYGHAMVATEDGTLLIIGGKQDDSNSHAQILKYVNNSEWQLLCVPDDFTWNDYARACYDKGTLYVHGGSPSKKLIGMSNVLSAVQYLHNDAWLHILTFCNRSELNNIMLTNKQLNKFASGTFPLALIL